ncbi:MAG: response regulator transcription factor, partial [Rhodothermales bacterium]|nr:response regulator transcription factor [Rhodothermales bacterium]
MSASQLRENVIRVVVADDHHMTRSGVKAALSTSAEIEVVGEAADGIEALEVVEKVKPAVLVLDVEMPRMTGVEVARKLKQRNSTIAILALSAFDDRDYVYGLLDCGASGYLMKEEADAVMLEDAVRSIALDRSEMWMSPNFAGRLVRSHLEDRRIRSLMDDLTEREWEVLREIGYGDGNIGIADKLCISVHTVKNHVEHIKSKLRVKSRAELVAWCWQNNIVHGREPRASGDEGEP